jgi:hypothetical protein
MADKKAKTGVGPVTDYLANKLDEAVVDEKLSEKQGDKSFGRMARNAGKAAMGMGAMVTAPVGAAYNMITTGKAFKDDSETKGTNGMKKGGKVSSASSRADGCAIKGKTKGRMV